MELASWESEAKSDLNVEILDPKSHWLGYKFTQIDYVLSLTGLHELHLSLLYDLISTKGKSRIPNVWRSLFQYFQFN